MPNPSFRTLLVFAAITVMVLSGAAMGLVSFHHAARAVFDVSARLRTEVSHRISDHLRYVLSQPPAVVSDIAADLDAGLLSAEAPDALARALSRKAGLYSAISSLYLGTPEGGLIGGGHEGDRISFYVTATPDGRAGTFSKRRLDARGQPAELLATVPDFDARTRPWYAMAMEADGFVWGAIYPLFTGQDMALSASAPVRDPDSGRVLGVVGTDIFLSQLGAFLASLHEDVPGLTFIVENSGLLVASSVAERPFALAPDGRPGARLKARDSRTVAIAQAARALEALAPGATTAHADDPLEITLNGDLHLVSVQGFSLPGGLSWRIVSVIPASSFQDSLVEGKRRSLLLIALSVAVMAVVMGLVAGRLLRPLADLTRSVDAVTRGDLTQQLSVTRDDELGSLARAFNTMTRRLKETSDDRDQQFAAISAAEARYANLFDSAAVSLWNIDLTAVARHLDSLRDKEVTDLPAYLTRHPQELVSLLSEVRILDVNQATLRLFDAPSPEALKHGSFDILGPNGRAVFVDLLCGIWTGVEAVSAESVLIGLSGRRVRALVTMRVPQTPEGFASLPISVLDITALKAAESSLREKKEELERSNAELESFAYVSAHDLREPLRNITSYTTLLSRRLSNRLSEEEEEFFGFIHSGALHMNNLICDLLDFSRVGRGEEISPQPVAMAEVVESVLGRFRSQIADTNATVTIADPLPTVAGNREDLERVIANLLGNALKYRQPDIRPELTLSASLDSPGLWRFDVTDNGIGIAPGRGYEERVFGLFQRLHRREEHGGTGIGLAICKKVIEHHGGRIWVVSKGAGLGCCFSFTLPAPPDQDATAGG